MCLNNHKVSISTEFVNEFCPSVLSVDCNRCAECNMRTYNSYVVRNWFEYSVVSSSLDGDAFAVMETLTYKDDFLPHFNGVPCFSATHITNFIKRLKEHWRRVLGRPLRFSYMIVCEYGGKKCRPHYHPIFYVLDKISKREFMRSVYDSWQMGSTNLVSEYGRERVKYAFDHILTSFAGVRYTLKYLFKYRDFDDSCKHILDTLCENYNVDSSDRLRHDFMYECRPFIRTSVGFGFVPSLLPNILDKDFVQIPCKDGRFQKLKLPSYILRKLCTEKVCVIDDYGAPVLRPNGKPEFLKTSNGSYVFKRTPLGVEYSVSQLPNLLNVHSQRIYNVLGTLPFGIKSIIYSLLDGRSVRQLSVYACVYRGRFVSSKYNLFVKDMFSVDTYTEFYRRCMSRVPLPLPATERVLSFWSDCRFINEDSFTEFRDFDFILDSLDLQTYIVDNLNDKQTSLLDTFKRVHDAYIVNH